MPSANSENVRYLIGSSLASNSYSVSRPLSRPTNHARINSQRRRCRHECLRHGPKRRMAQSRTPEHTGARLHPVLKLAAARALPLPEDLLVQFYAESRPFGLHRETVLHHGRIPGQGEDATVPAGHRRFTGEEVHDGEIAGASGSTAADARADGVERGARGNEQGLSIFSAEDQLQRTLGDLNGVDQFAGGIVDVDLAGGDVDVAALVDSDAFTALLGEEFLIGQVAVRADRDAPGGQLGFVGEVIGFAGNRGCQSETPHQVAALDAPTERAVDKVLAG